MTPHRALDWALAAVALTAPLSIAALNLSLGLLTVAALWAWRGEPALRAAAAASLRSPAFLLLAASAAWALVSGLTGVDPTKSLSILPKELHKLWAFLVLACAFGAARRGRALRALGAGLGAAAAMGAFQTLTLSGGEAGFVRARAFVHAVSYGEMMGLGLLGAAAWLAIETPRGRQRGAVLAAAAVLTVALALNQTRAVLLALAAAVPVAALAAPRLRRGLTAAFLLLAAVALAWEFMPTGGRNMRNLLYGGRGAAAHRSRLVLWDAALDIARERPVTGVGPGAFRRAFEERRGADALDKERVWGTAHNLYLHQLAERGVPGLMLLLALFAALGAAALKAWRERGDAPALWALACVAAFAVMNLTETAWQTEQVATFFLLCWSWGAGPRP